MKQMSRVVLTGAWLSLALCAAVCAQEAEELTGGDAVRDTGGAGSIEGDGIFIELVDPFEVGFDGGDIAGVSQAPFGSWMEQIGTEPDRPACLGSVVGVT